MFQMTLHFEIYTFNNATTTRAGTAGASGIDFNYGAAPDLQLTATLPAGFDRLGIGWRYDLNDNYHLLGYVGRGIENTYEADQVSWYASVLFTF
jgi:hypothetical protein